jgi:uncharacterized protein YndB with AHSA1/START domain
MAATDAAPLVTLPNDTEILITRDFAAPRHLVYRAWTTPELIARWWHAKRGTITSIEVDLRVGGTWRYVMTAHGGFEVAFHGEYLEVVQDERIVSTEIFEGAPDAAAVGTTRFAETDGGTRLTITVTHSSQQNRDLHLQSGMEDGLRDALDLLADLVSTDAASDGEGDASGSPS